MSAFFTLLVVGPLLPFVLSKCYDPSPAFPIPLWTNGRTDLEPAFHAIEEKLGNLIQNSQYDRSSYSVEVTSNTETLWSNFHTARKRNPQRPGGEKVDENSLYRIASITKTFTVLSILYQANAGNVSLDDPISKYIPELASHDAGKLPWKDITLRILASQLSGIPREFAQSDAINELSDPTAVGLPPATKKGLPPCDEYADYRPCGKKDLIENLKKRNPVFAPNFKPTYSNVAFELLGLVIEEVTGMSYTAYVRKAIFEPLEMKSSSLQKPSDTHAVLPDLDDNYWDVDEGVQNPTGGIYSSSFDMSKFVRYILTHYNALATGVNWMNPASYAAGMNSFYGMPFEIFRTDKILTQSKRPVTFVTKSGGLPAYESRISMLPEYGLGLTVLVGGEYGLISRIQEIATVELVRGAEDAIWQDVSKTYSGTYTSTRSSLNSSLELAVSPSGGLTVTRFISNSTDVFATLLPALTHEDIKPGGLWRAQLTPTLLYKDEARQRGEVWRLEIVPEREGKEDEGQVWDDFCATDVDTTLYAGRPMNELIFWHEHGEVELPAWEVRMRKTDGRKEGQDGQSLFEQVMRWSQTKLKAG